MYMYVGCWLKYMYVWVCLCVGLCIHRWEASQDTELRQYK